MKTLANSNSFISNTTLPPNFSASSFKERLLSGGPESISFRTPWKLPNSVLLHLKPLYRGGIDLISCFSSHSQVDTQNEEVVNQDTNKSKTVRVKFQLQKECTFGDHFFIVGDDPMFGSWDVTNAIPLNWADGHQWAAEVEIPVGKTIQFKFVLQGITGNVVWQPDPDRTFQPWETTNTIIISEDWDSAESRILYEEEKIDNQDVDSLIVAEKLLVEESLTYINGEQVNNTNKGSPVALFDTSVAEKSLIESHGELIDGTNVSALQENTSNAFLSEDNASNIPSSKENIMAEALKANNKAVSEVQSNSNGEMTVISQSDTVIAKEILKKEETDATFKILGNTDVQGSIIDYGVPILVPGLPPTTATSSQDVPQHEVRDDVFINGINETIDHKLPQKQDAGVVVAEQEMEAKSSYEEDAVESEIIQESNTNKIENDIVQNDITWGHKTLKKFFSSLRLL